MALWRKPSQWQEDGLPPTFIHAFDLASYSMYLSWLFEFLMLQKQYNIIIQPIGLKAWWKSRIPEPSAEASGRPHQYHGTIKTNLPLM